MRHSFSHQNFFDAYAQVNRGFSQGNLGQMILGGFHIIPGTAAVDKYLRENPDVGQIATIAGAVACSVMTSGVGTPACVAGVTAMYQANMGASNGNIIRHAAVAFAQTYALQQIGGELKAGLSEGNLLTNPAYYTKIVAHAVVGCISSAATGGECESGAISGGFGAATSPWLPNEAAAGGGIDWSIAGPNLVISGIMGGIGSELSGGNFRDGFKTAAWGYLFNELAHQTTNAQRGYADSSTARGASVLYGPVEGGELYDRMVFVLDADGLVVATYRGSVDPDLARANCANGCPTIATGTHAITAADRQKYGGTVLVVGNNGTVPTEGPNPNQGGQSFATGVYVHTGYRTTTGAEGCLTINPAQWKPFISHFPTGARGTVTVVR